MTWLVGMLWVAALPGTPAVTADEVAAAPDAWTLFSDRETVEQDLTRIVRNNVYANTGHRLGDG